MSSKKPGIDPFDELDQYDDDDSLIELGFEHEKAEELLKAAYRHDGELTDAWRVSYPDMCHEGWCITDPQGHGFHDASNLTLPVARWMIYAHNHYEALIEQREDYRKGAEYWQDQYQEQRKKVRQLREQVEENNGLARQVIERDMRIVELLQENARLQEARESESV